jgi:hypothetical protein
MGHASRWARRVAFLFALMKNEWDADFRGFGG